VKLPDRIPPLAGPVRVLYRVIGGLLILLTLLAGTVGTYLLDSRNADAARTFYAAGLRNTTPRVEGLDVAAFSDQARAAGVPNGRLVAVDGIDVRDDDIRLEKTLRALAGPEGSTVEVRIADATDVRAYRLTRSAGWLRQAYAGTGFSFAVRERIRLVLDIAAGLLVVAVIALLYLRRPRDPVAALLVVGATVLTLGPLPAIAAWIPAWLTPVCYFVGMSAVHAGLILFPSASLRPRRVLAALAAIILLALAPTILTQAWVLPLSVTLESFITLAVIVTRFRQAPPGIERQQIKWAALGLSGFALFFFVQAMLMAGLDAAPDEGMRAWFILFAILAANLAVLSLCGGLLIALLRYRLYDAEAAISRSAVIATLTLALLAIFTATEKAIETFGQDYFGSSLGGMAGGFAAALAAVLVAPLHHLLTRWSENRFQKDLIDLRRKLPALVADLRETSTTPELAGQVLQRAAGILRATCGAVTAAGEVVAVHDVAPKRLEDWCASWAPATDTGHDIDPEDPLFPVRIALDSEGTGRIGWLLLGRRPDGSLYGKDEREVLSEIADPIARALAITMRREADARAARAAAERIEARVASLEERIERSLPRPV
jgi:hypothetical protein